MYDGVSTGYPVEPALANIFVGFHEKRFLSSPNECRISHRWTNNEKLEDI